MNYFKKYLKYKNKYLQYGAATVRVKSIHNIGKFKIDSNELIKQYPTPYHEINFQTSDLPLDEIPIQTVQPKQYKTIQNSINEYIQIIYNLYILI